MPFSERHAWIAVVLAAVVVRLGAFASLPGVFDFVSTGTIHGSDAYDAYAVNLLATGTYGREPGVADAAIPPFYSVVLAAAYAIAGRSALTVALLHTAFDVASMALLRSVAIALLGVPLAGTLAAAGMACYPYLVFQSLAVNDTSLFILQLHLFIWLAIRLRAAGTRAAVAAIAAAAGLVLGVGVLTRPVLLPLAGWAALWWRLRLPTRDTLARLAVVTLTCGLVVAGWSARNRAVYGVPFLIATNGGSNFWQGNNPLSRAYLEAGYDVQWIPAGPLGTIDHRDPASNGAFFAEALRFLRQHPDQIPGLAWAKLRVHWSLDVTPTRNPAAQPGTPRGLDRVQDVGADGGAIALSGLSPEDAVSLYSQPLFDRYGRLVHRAFWGLVLGLAVAGAWLTRRAWREVSLIWFVQANMTLAYVVFHPSTRYRLPSDPLLMVLSAAAVLWLAGWLARLRRRAPRRTPGA